MEQTQPNEPELPGRRKNDILWKVVMEEVFDDLLRFIFPDADLLFDMERGFEFLDKELTEMHPEPGKKPATLFADKLVKVFTREGREEWVLCHVEVQGQTKAKDRPIFASRMFRYFYRIWDRHQKPVSAIAFFTGRDAQLMPDRFEYEYRNTKVLYKFPVISVLDFKDADLGKSDNSFAQVLLAARISLLEGVIPDNDLLDKKVLIATQLLKKGFPEKKTRALLTFLENSILFKDPEMNRVFKQKIQSHDKNNVMGIDEYLKMVAKEEGLEEGLQEGRKKGIQQGLQQGLQKGLKEGRKEEKKKRTQLVVKNLLTSTRFSVKKIASLVCVTETFVKKVKKDLATPPSGKICSR
jgi:predicted transposase YdaD